MSRHDPADASGAAPTEDPIPASARLSRNAPLVPVDSAASRALVAVIAILAFLAALCAGAAEMVAAGSAQWRASVAREATIQVRPTAQGDIEALVARAVALARQAPGVDGAEAITRAESERLLEPWLGAGLNLGDLPVPRLVVVRLAEGARPDFTDLKRRLADEVPGATLDDHGVWLARLSTMAGTVVALGAGLVLLVLVAAGLAVAFATRGAMAGNKETVEVLHFVGAGDDYIAGEFQDRFVKLGLKGGVAGAAGAVGLIVGLGLVSASWRASPAGDQLEALFGAFDMSWRGYAVMVLIALVVAAITGLVSRLTVRRFLRKAR